MIVPTWNEASTIDRCLTRLIKQRPEEILVADGGSPDGTFDLAKAYEPQGVQALLAPKGRAAQQNHASRIATGDIFLFLHADCWLDDGALDEIRRFVEIHPRVPGGCLRMRVESPRPYLYASVNAAADLRGSWLGLPYGDQAMFATRWAFERVGGFPIVKLMDDLLLSLELRRLGRLAILKSAVCVSDRRWRQQGILRQSMRNWALTAAAALGVPPDELARFYPVVR